LEMPRRKAIAKRVILPDVRFGSVVVAKIINCAMNQGKKSVAESAIYEALGFVAEKLAISPTEVLEAVINNIRPLVEVKSRRVGGATYQVPCDVNSQRSLALGIRWLIMAARARKDKKTFADRLSAELLDAHSGKGEAFKRRENTHKMAEANRAFIHFNW
jgi:small subunit ribosomal protein S7